MNKAALIEMYLKQYPDATRRQATEAVNFFFHPTEGLIATQLRSGKPLALTGFGTFEMRKTKARTARNPRTGEAIKVAAGKRPVFKAGATLKSFVTGKSAAAPARGAAKKGAARGAAKKGAAKRGR